MIYTYFFFPYFLPDNRTQGKPDTLKSPFIEATNNNTNNIKDERLGLWYYDYLPLESVACRPAII